MGFIFSGLFWGGMLVLLGISLILNLALGIRIPFFRIFFALLLFYIGISILVGSSHWYRHGRNDTVFEERRVGPTEPAGKHDVVFGNAEIDLTGIELKGQMQNMEINTVFGSSRVEINPDQPVEILVSSAFAEARMPDGNDISFGDYTYRSPGFDEHKPCLRVKASVVFGRTDIVEKRPAAAPESKEGGT